MLQNSWKDTTYQISSLTDRRPVEDSDDLIVLAAPDPQGQKLTLRYFCEEVAASRLCAAVPFRAAHQELISHQARWKISELPSTVTWINVMCLYCYVRRSLKNTK